MRKYRHEDSTDSADDTTSLPNLLLSENLQDQALGNKTVGNASSYVYVINQIFGPGVLAIPIVYQQSGWLLTALSIIIFFILSSFATTCLVEAMTALPGNARFEKRIEYALCTKYFFGRKVYLLFQLFLNICLGALTISSIIVTVPAFDYLFANIWKSCAVEPVFSDSLFRVNCTSSLEEVASWFESGHWITLGYLAAFIFIFPMSLFNLDGNIIFQWISFFGLIIINVEFLIDFMTEGLHETKITPFGGNYSQLMGVMLTSWSYVMVIPSWVNEKKPNVSVNKVIWRSSFVSTLAYLFLSLFIAMGFPAVDSDDMLLSIQDMSNLPLKATFPQQNIAQVTAYFAYLFSLFIILPGAPVFQISIRYNLYVGEICGKKQGYFWSSVAPWLVSWIFIQASFFASLLVWTSLIFGSIVNFVIPFVLYYRSVVERNADEWSKRSAPFQDELEDLFVKDRDKMYIHRALPETWRPYAKAIALTLLGIVSTLVGTQIIVSLVYAFQGKSFV